MANIDFIKRVEEEVTNRINTPEEIGGFGLMIPNNTTNAGQRKIMEASQAKQVISLVNPEPALIQTGYENRFGEYVSSFLKAESNYEVIAKISKFSFLPEHDYTLIVKNLETGECDCIRRVDYEHISETYGFSYNNDYLDSLKVGSVIRKGDTYKKSTNYDEYDNRQDGVNLMVAFLSKEHSKEDGIPISESCAKKLRTRFYKTIQISMNDNDIPLNLLGDEEVYKSIPNIGEEIPNHILTALRREKNEESLYTLSVNRLRKLLMSDEVTTVKGTVVDINVYTNNPELLKESYYNSQINFYYEQQMRYTKEFVDIVNMLKHKGYKFTYELQKTYYNLKKVLNGNQYIRDETPFSNTIIEFGIIEEADAEIGDKLSNRYSGKGVISKIVPDEQMPLLDNGERVDMIMNPSSIFNRTVGGLLIEPTLNHMSSRILEHISKEGMNIYDCLEEILKFINIVKPEQAKFYRENLSKLSPQELPVFIDSLVKSGGIVISLDPYSDIIGIDTLIKLYNEFPYIEKNIMLVPQEDSNGNIRFIKSKNPIVAGKLYTWRLKQYAEEKVSAVSLSSTSIQNENAKNPSKRNYKSLHAKTPIRFGTMETGDLLHMGAEKVIINLMIHSASPHGRRLSEKLLTGDPFNIDVRLDKNAKNRKVEILNAYLTTMGLRIKFIKKPKVKPLLFEKRNLFVSTDIRNRDSNGKRNLFVKLKEDEKIDVDRIIEAYHITDKILFYRDIFEKCDGFKPYDEILEERKKKKQSNE